MNLRIILALGLASLPLSAGFADDQDSAGPSPLILSLLATHDAQLAVPVGTESWDTGYNGSMKQPQIENDFQLEAKQGPLKGVFSTEVVNSPSGTSLQFQDNYVSWNPDSFRLAFGYQIFAWGTADGANPTDNLNPRDYTSVSGDKIRKLPVLASSVTWYPSEQISVEAVYVPFTGTSLFPTDYVASLQSQGIQSSVANLDGSVGNSIAGGRINYRTSSFEASVSYLYDLDAMYTPIVNPDFSVTLVRKRIQRLGADFKTNIAGFGLWAEGCYSLTGNSEADNESERLSQWQQTVGFDFSFGPEDAGYADIQYEATWIPGFDDSANTYAQTDVRYLRKSLLYSLGGIESEWLHSIIINTHYNLASDTVTPSMSMTYSIPVNYDQSAGIHYGSLLLKPELEVVPVDAFHITIGAVLAWSWIKAAGQSGASLDTSDSVGVYTPQNNVFLAVSYQWNTTTNK
jgi:hypothetical protein